MCDHLRSLGIAPFFKPGDTCDDINHLFTGDIKPRILDMYKKTYSEDTCVVCMDDQPSVLFYPCNHNFTCFDCANKINKCPYCKANILYRFPY